MQVLDALGHAHRGGVVHRDLKPANLMITDTGTVKVMDFGIARVLGSEHFTHGGYMMGTPAYMAPEQVLGREIDGRADLYSVGVVLYRLLTGHLPFNADTAISMVQMQISEAPTPILNFRSDLPPWCVTIIDRALAKSPADRFQSAEEFRSALLAAVTPQALGEMPTMATPTPPGLTFDPEVTAPHRTPSMMRTAPSPKTSPSLPSGVNVSTPGATKVPAPATARPVVPKPPTPTPLPEKTTTLVLGRNHLMALAGLAVVVAVGVALLAFAALRGSRTPAPVRRRRCRGSAGGAATSRHGQCTPAGCSSRQFLHDASRQARPRRRRERLPGAPAKPTPSADRSRPATSSWRARSGDGRREAGRAWHCHRGVAHWISRGRPFDDSDR